MIRRCLSIVVAVLTLSVSAQAQATRIISSGTLPATCSVGNIYLKTGASSGFYVCLVPDTWSGPLVGAGSVDSITRSFGITIDAGSDAIDTGVKGFVTIPFAGTITEARLLSTNASTSNCSIVIDVWVDSFANYPPDNSDSITASAPPTLSTDNEVSDTTLTGWDTAIMAGDIAGFNVDSGDCTRVTLTLTVEE